MKKINCLITGITGMVGSHLLDFLIEKTNWNIYGLIRWSSKLDNIEHHLHKINKGKRKKVIRKSKGLKYAVTEKQPLGVVHPQRMEGQQSVVLQMT